MSIPIGIGTPVTIDDPPVTIDPTPVTATPVDTFPLTWLATFTVQCDMPQTMSVSDMENAIAFGVVQYLQSLGHTGNCSAQLLATAGNVSVAMPVAKPVAVAIAPVTKTQAPSVGV